MAGPGRLTFAQARGPASDGAGAIAAGDAALGDGIAIGLDDGGQSPRQHPVEHVERRQRELELQRLVPDLLLRTAQEDEILDLGPGPRQQAPAQPQHEVERARRIAGGAQHVAQHHEPVAGLPVLHQCAAQPLQRGIVAGQGAERPRGAAPAQAGDRGNFGHDRGDARRAVEHEKGGSTGKCRAAFSLMVVPGPSRRPSAGRC